MNHRIIVRLDIKGPNLVKGVHLEGLRVLGNPSGFAKYYYEAGADELLYMDVVASLYERNSLQEIINKAAKNIFIPLTVGGGIRTIEDIKNVLKVGADKVSINSEAIRNHDFIREASNLFGSSTIAVAIEAIKQSNDKYLAFIDNGREYTGVEVLSWAKRVENLGAGEIILTSVDRDGTGKGFDIDLIKMVSSNVNIPVVAHGGAGKYEHIKEVFDMGGANAVAIASILHYYLIGENKALFKYKGEGNIDFLMKGQKYNNIEKSDITSIKEYLFNNNIKCRYYR
jgi:cyclase